MKCVIKSVYSVVKNPLLQYYLWEVWLLLGKLLSYNSIVTGTKFSKSVNVGAGRSSGDREHKYTLGANTNLRLILAPPWWKGPTVIYLHPRLWLVPLGNGAISGSHCWSTASRLDIQLWKEPDQPWWEKNMLLSLCIVSTPTSCILCT